MPDLLEALKAEDVHEGQCVYYVDQNPINIVTREVEVRFNQDGVPETWMENSIYDQPFKWIDGTYYVSKQFALKESLHASIDMLSSLCDDLRRKLPGDEIVDDMVCTTMANLENLEEEFDDLCVND